MHTPPVALLAANGATSFMPLISMSLVVLILYFLVMRPQAKRQREREAMLKRVEKGDRVLTTSGMYGQVVAVRGDDTLIVKIADNVKVEMARQAVAQIVARGEEGGGG